jgi:hypothetical protein
MTTRAQWARELRELARSKGWTVTPTRGGHVKLTRPGSGPVYADVDPERLAGFGECPGSDAKSV